MTFFLKFSELTVPKPLKTNKWVFKRDKELEPKIAFLVQVISPTLHNFMPIADYQVFIALFLALATGIFAVRLGVALYK